MATARGSYVKRKKLTPYGQTKKRRVTITKKLKRKPIKLLKRKKRIHKKYKKKLHSILV